MSNEPSNFVKYLLPYGVRPRRLDTDHLQLLGKNRGVLLLVAILAAMALGLFDQLFVHPFTSFSNQAGLAVVMIFLVGLSGWATFYVADTLPMRRTIIFSNTGISYSDRLLTGSAMLDIAYQDVVAIIFSVNWPSGSVFKVVQVFVQCIDTPKPVPLVIRKIFTMYSWQGKAAYDQLREFLEQHGQPHLLAEEPDFSWSDK